MARLTNIKLRRSGTSGNVPTTSQLDLGELAINTYDGKLYLKKNVGGTESIVDIGGGGQTAVYKEYVYTATSNQTTFTGSDDNSQTLTYIPDFLQVFLNGVLLENGTDYTATSLTSVVLINGASAGDILQISTFVKVLGRGDVVTDTFTGNGSTAAYTLSATPDNEDNISVFADGVYQEKSTYSLSGNTLTFNANLPNGVTAEVVIGSNNVTLTNIADLNISGNLTLVDNKKISFGDDGDLEIYHDTNNSIIKDNGTGHVQVRSGTVTIGNAALSKTSALFSSGGAQTFYHDNSTKLATTSTGINVTGEVKLSNTAVSNTASTNTSSTTQTQIYTFPAAVFRTGKFTIQVTNNTDDTYHITELLLVHDGTTPSITEFGEIHTGSAVEATFDADINSGNVRLLATPAASDSMTFRVLAHNIIV